MTGVESFTSDDDSDSDVTGQVELDSYVDAGVLTSVDLVNGLAIGFAHGRPVPQTDPRAVIATVLAVDPPSLAMFTDADRPGIVALAHELREAFVELSDDRIDDAATRLNDLLAAHPAHPHLAKENGEWRLHHHPVDAALVPMCTAICAEGMARMVGMGHAERLGTCAAPDCDRVFIDVSKNASRRFCSTTCQNRVKAAAFRQRRTGTA